MDSLFESASAIGTVELSTGITSASAPVWVKLLLIFEGTPEGALAVGAMRGRQPPFSDKHAKVEKEGVLLTLVKNERAVTRVKKLMGCS